MSSISAALLLILFFHSFVPRLQAQEEQVHGLVFENWINDTFFYGHRPGYSEKWDIPAEINTSHGGIPINPKLTKWGSSVYLGDAPRQIAIDEPFILILGFWEQRGTTKHLINITPIRIDSATWRKLWHPLTSQDVAALDALIKDRSLDYKTARKLAHDMNSRPPYSLSIIRLNPKIDSRGQRRLQCSLRFRDIPKLLYNNTFLEKSEAPELWGKKITNPIKSDPRKSISTK